MSPGRRRRISPRGTKMLEVMDVAKRLGVHKTTVYRWINKGLLYARKDRRWGIYMVTEAELSKFRGRFRRGK